jgi:hypothetical protein
MVGVQGNFKPSIMHFTLPGTVVSDHLESSFSMLWMTSYCLLLRRKAMYDLGSVDEHCGGGGTNGPCQKYKALNLHNVVF